MISRASLALTVVLAMGTARAEVTLVGIATMPGTATDLSGLDGKLADGTPHNRLGGLGSAIAYTGRGSTYLLASDRGPVDGASDYRCRVHQYEIEVRPTAKPPVVAKITETRLLSSEGGLPLIGATHAVSMGPKAKALRFDPEGIRIGRQGTFFLSDEYGPSVCEFEASGKRLRSLPVPLKFTPTKPGKPEDELPPKNRRGRQPNRGFEGLAISPDGSKLFAALQSPLIQDGALGDGNARIGHNNRILEVNLGTSSTREFVYPMDDASHGVNEILAVGESTFLVLERDGLGGKDAKFKKVFLIDTARASDVSDVESLPVRGLPKGASAVKKTAFLDLLNPVYRIVGKDAPEKFEGLAFGPDLPDGRRLLLVTADNDFIAGAPFRIYAFAVDRADLPAFQPQQFAK